MTKEQELAIRALIHGVFYNRDLRGASFRRGETGEEITYWKAMEVASAMLEDENK